MTAGLDVGPTTAQLILSSAEALLGELADGPAGRLAPRLRSLSERLVADLIPSLDAKEAVVHQYLDDQLRIALDADHRAVRLLTERLQSLADFVERVGARGRKVEPVRRALRETIAALTSLVDHQRAGVRHLEQVLQESARERLAAELERAATTARERTMLIVSPVVPPRASTVLRKRPDLETAYALSLAAVERSLHKGGQ